MRARFVAVLPWALFALLVAMWAAALWFDRGSDEVTAALDKLWALSFFAFPVVGVFLARRIPANAVGWLFIIGPLLVGAGVALQEMAETLDFPGLVDTVRDRLRCRIARPVLVTDALPRWATTAGHGGPGLTPPP